MPFTDFILVLNWWLIIFFIGFTFLPLTTIIFNSFFDRGYVFSKILGILFLSFSVWIISSLHIISFSFNTIVLCLLVFTFVNLFLLKTRSRLNLLTSAWRIFLFEEVLFFIALLFWSFIRAHSPEIHGLEKFMDFGFVNSILRAEYFPPKDMWFTPENINYYYFGHLVTAVLTKLSGADSSISFNLMLANIFAITLTASFSIGANLFYYFQPSKLKSSISGLISAYLVTLSGNMHSIYAFFNSYDISSPVPFWELAFKNNLTTYWYANATRFIPKTIHEFPIYTTVVADLHGHVLNIPFALLTIAILIKYYFEEKTHYLIYVLIGLMIAISLMTNFLDAPIYLMLASLVVYFKNAKDRSFADSITLNARPLLIILLSIGIFSLPFWLSFKPFGSGIGIICSPILLTEIGRLGPLLFEPDKCVRTPLWMFLILYGLFIFLFLRFLFAIVISRYKSQSHHIDSLILIFFIFGILGILIPEVIYFKDIYSGHFRANTLFKFSYQVFIVLSLISGYIIVRTFPKSLGIKQAIFVVSLFFLLFLAGSYPYFAIKSYYHNLENYQGLDGIKYISKTYPEDYQAIVWLNKNIEGQPVILEAVGESYTDYARVSANTGLPTVVCWPVH